MSKPLVCGIDPGEVKLGLHIADTTENTCDYYLCSLTPFVVKPKRVTKAKKKRRSTNAQLRMAIERFIEAVSHIFEKCQAILFEEQKISVARIKFIAKCFYEICLRRFGPSGCDVRFVDPKLYRAHWAITVLAKDHPKTSKQNLRLIRKHKSFHNTELIPDKYRPLVVDTFTIDSTCKKKKKTKEFCVDPVEAGLMASYYIHCQQKGLDVSTGKKRVLSTEERPSKRQCKVNLEDIPSRFYIAALRDMPIVTGPSNHETK